MRDFWSQARLMLAHPGLIALSFLFAFLSAGGLGAGLLAIKPVLDVVLGQGRDLPALATQLNTLLSARSYPAWLRVPDGLIASLPTGAFSAVLWIMIGLALLTVFGALANFLHQFFSLTLVSRTIGQVRRNAFARLVRLPLLSVMKLGASDAVSRVVYDTSTLAAGLNALLSKTLGNVLKGAAALLAAIALDWRVSIVALLVAPLLAVVIRKFGKRIRRGTRAALSAQAGLYQSAAAAVQGLRVVKVHTAEENEALRFGALSDEVVKQELRVRTARALASPAVELLTILALGVLVLVAIKAILDKHLDPAEFVLVLGALGVAGASLKPVTSLIADIQVSSAAATRLCELLALRPEAPGVAGDAARSFVGSTATDTPGVPLPRHRLALTFDNVSLTYPGAAHPAVDSVSLDIVHGQTVAFVGPNGSGKTSLLALVPRLFDPDAPGRVLIDGVDIRTVDLATLRGQIGVVTQETVLFPGTIRDNIAYGTPGATDPLIADAARRARAEEFILQRPGGYASTLGEAGTGLSGGQRQRLAIARAILRDPAILILDEATSMIDAHSEASISSAIDDFVSAHDSARTCLIVAHRLSTVMHADRIVVMDRGRIVDQGAHAELLARCEVYRQLAQHQLVRESPATPPTATPPTATPTTATPTTTSPSAATPPAATAPATT